MEAPKFGGATGRTNIIFDPSTMTNEKFTTMSVDIYQRILAGEEVVIYRPSEGNAPLGYMVLYLNEFGRDEERGRFAFFINIETGTNVMFKEIMAV